MKKILSALKGLMLAAVIMLCFSAVSYANDSSEIKIYLDGKAVAFDSAPIIENGRTLVPLRAIFEAMDAEVLWDDATKTVTAARGDTKIKMTIGEAQFYVNETVVALDVPAKIVNSRTMVPARAIAESFGVDVSWNDSARAVVLCDDEFLKLYNNSLEIVNEVVFDGKVDYSVGFFKGTLKLKLGEDMQNKLVAFDAKTEILGQSIETTIAASEEKTITIENGEKTVSDGVEIALGFDNNAVDVLLYLGEEGDYKIYRPIDPASGAGMQLKGYINKNTLKLEKILIEKEVAQNMISEPALVVENDIILDITYNSGEVKKIWDECNK